MAQVTAGAPMKKTCNTKNSLPSVFKSADGERRVMELYDRMLAQWPVEHELMEIPTRHGKTFIIASGNHDADRLILLHGAGSNSLMWIDDIKQYSRHFRVYAVDLIGEAGKSSANRPAWDGPAYEEWLADIYDGLHIARATIIGVSQGGWTALKFATARPEQIDRLVLICPGGIIPDRMLFVIYAFTLSIMGSPGVRRIVKMLFGDEPVPEPVLEAMTTTMQHFSHRVGFPPRFSDAELAALTMPIHFIGGTKDVLRDSAKIAERLRRLVPQLSVDLISGGGHAISDTTCRILPFILTDKTPDLQS